MAALKVPPTRFVVDTDTDDAPPADAASRHAGTTTAACLGLSAGKFNEEGDWTDEELDHPAPSPDQEVIHAGSSMVEVDIEHDEAANGDDENDLVPVMADHILKTFGCLSPEGFNEAATATCRKRCERERALAKTRVTGSTHAVLALPGRFQPCSSSRS